MRYVLLRLHLWAVLLSVSAGSAWAQADPWAPLQFLVGSWVGEETGAAGIGKAIVSMSSFLKASFSTPGTLPVSRLRRRIRTVKCTWTGVFSVTTSSEIGSF